MISTRYADEIIEAGFGTFFRVLNTAQQQPQQQQRLIQSALKKIALLKRVVLVHKAVAPIRFVLETKVGAWRSIDDERGRAAAVQFGGDPWKEIDEATLQEIV